METQRTYLVSTFQFRFSYELLDAEIRKCPHTIGHYLPNLLTFTLEVETTDGKRPSYNDLEAHSATLWGLRVKKDGTVGKSETKENFYTYGNYPDWINRIIAEAARELREGKQ